MKFCWLLLVSTLAVILITSSRNFKWELFNAGQQNKLNDTKPI